MGEHFQRSMQAKRNHQAGFSLLELLVSITIMGFVGSAMAAGLRLGTNIWQASTAQNQALYDSGTLSQSLRPLLGQANARLFKQVGGISTIFNGTPNAVAFLSQPPKALTSTSVHLFKLYQSGDALVLQMIAFDPSRPLAAPLDAAAHVDEPGTQTRLLRGVSDVQIRYFGQTHGSVTPYWSDEWNNQPALPSLLEITLEPLAGARWQLPPLVFALETAV